jgi:hypothetical protein
MKRKYKIILIDQENDQTIIETEVDRISFNMNRDILGVLPYGWMVPQYFQQNGPATITIHGKTDNHHEFNIDEIEAFCNKED